MTLFEYISVAISVVLSLSAAQLLGNFRLLFDSDRRYWVHAIWVVHLLFLHVSTWWAFWALRDFSGWDLGTFGFVLSGYAAVFIASSALVPSNTSISLSEHFYAQRVLFFAALGFLVPYAWGRSAILLDDPFFEPARLVGLVYLLVCAIGVYSSSHRVHAVLVIVSLVNLVVGVGYFRFVPGTLSAGP